MNIAVTSWTTENIWHMTVFSRPVTSLSISFFFYQTTSGFISFICFIECLALQIKKQGLLYILPFYQPTNEHLPPGYDQEGVLSASGGETSVLQSPNMSCVIAI